MAAAGAADGLQVYVWVVCWNKRCGIHKMCIYDTWETAKDRLDELFVEYKRIWDTFNTYCPELDELKRGTDHMRPGDEFIYPNLIHYDYKLDMRRMPICTAPGHGTKAKR